MFAASDPFYMLMYYHILGRKNYVVWDKSASIKFVAPGKSTLHAEFIISDEEIEMVKDGIKNNVPINRDVEWKDIHGKVHAVINRSIYAASKEFYNNRKKLIS